MSLFGDIHINVSALHIHVLNDESKAAISKTLANTATILEGISAMATSQDQAADRLEALGTKLDKISGETTSLVATVAELKAAAAEAGNISPRMQTALDNLDSKADAIDGLVDDIAPNPTPTPGDGGDTGPTEPGPGDQGRPSGSL